MAYTKISLGNGISKALILISYVTGIKGMSCSYAEQVTYSLADVAQMCQFQSVISTNSPHWYHEGMEISAYSHNGLYWVKRIITWAITNAPSCMPEKEAKERIAAAFEKYAEVIPFTFVEVMPSQQPDVEIIFKPMEYEVLSRTRHNPGGSIADNLGKIIFFNDTKNWTNRDEEEWFNFRFAALHEIGHVMGLADTPNPQAVMYEMNMGFYLTDEPVLDGDDIQGLQNLYIIDSLASGSTALTYGSVIPGTPSSSSDNDAPRTESSYGSVIPGTSSSSSDNDAPLPS